MITEAYLPITVHLDHREIPVCMLYIYEFSETQTSEILDITVSEVKKVRERLRCKLGGRNAQGLTAHALKATFNINGTLLGQDIFTDEKKRMIQDIDPTIEFLFPIHKLTQAPI
ncbi:MAG: hypothetical protein V4615_11910 [Bacteroidota bacterium]